MVSYESNSRICIYTIKAWINDDTSQKDTKLILNNIFIKGEPAVSDLQFFQRVNPWFCGECKFELHHVH